MIVRTCYDGGISILNISISAYLNIDSDTSGVLWVKFTHLSRSQRNAIVEFLRCDQQQKSRNFVVLWVEFIHFSGSQRVAIVGSLSCDQQAKSAQ